MQKPDNRAHGLFGHAARHSVKSLQPKTSLAALDMVTAHELDNLRQALRSETLPLDLRAKLARLRTDDPREHFLKQRSALLIGLLTAVETGEYRLAAPEDREQLLRVLAYLRKDADAIPDSLQGGFADDHDLMRQVCNELKPVLDRYKSWHLARRVPLLWQAARRSRDAAEPDQRTGATSRGDSADAGIASQRGPEFGAAANRG